MLLLLTACYYHYILGLRPGSYFNITSYVGKCISYPGYNNPYSYNDLHSLICFFNPSCSKCSRAVSRINYYMSHYTNTSIDIVGVIVGGLQSSINFYHTNLPLFPMYIDSTLSHLGAHRINSYPNYIYLHNNVVLSSNTHSLNTILATHFK